MLTFDNTGLWFTSLDEIFLSAEFGQHSRKKYPFLWRSLNFLKTQRGEVRGSLCVSNHLGTTSAQSIQQLQYNTRLTSLWQIHRLDPRNRSIWAKWSIHGNLCRTRRSTRLSPNVSSRLDSAQLVWTVVDSIDLGVTLAQCSARYMEKVSWM